MESLRIDKWLWFARFCKSRSLAARLVESGEVWRNGLPVDKPSQPVRVGDEVCFPLGKRICTVQVLALGSRRGPAPEAQGLYDVIGQ